MMTVKSCEYCSCAHLEVQILRKLSGSVPRRRGYTYLAHSTR
jgi:hypothetical protein